MDKQCRRRTCPGEQPLPEAPGWRFVPQCEVHLQPLELHHAEGIQHVASDPLVGPLAGSPHPVDPDWGRSYCAWRTEARHTGEALTFAVMAGDQVIGCTSLYDFDRGSASAEFSIWLAPTHWHQRIGSRTAQTLLHFAFMSAELTVVRARCLGDNVPARRFLESLGFTSDDGWHVQEGHAARDSAQGLTLTAVEWMAKRTYDGLAVQRPRAGVGLFSNGTY